MPNNKVQRFLHPLKSIIGPDPLAVNKWDKLNLKRKVVAIGSVDAHAHKQNVLGFYNIEIFPYKVLFKSVRTHVLLNEQILKGNSDKFYDYKKRIIHSLKEGKSFIANHYHGDAKGFRFFAEYDGNTYQLGDDIHFEKSKAKKVIFNAFIPREADLKLIRNGKIYDTYKGAGCVWDTDEPGNYRIECWIADKAWIFSNYIRIV